MTGMEVTKLDIDFLGKKVDRVTDLLESQDPERPGLLQRVRDIEEERRREIDERKARNSRLWTAVLGGGALNAFFFWLLVEKISEALRGVRVP